MATVLVTWNSTGIGKAAAVPLVRKGQSAELMSLTFAKEGGLNRLGIKSSSGLDSPAGRHLAVGSMAPERAVGKDI